ncbi:MAG: penicillin-binding protein 1C [Spirochaetae bacterium HGW-Spirochaetae-3]|jgi:penicillin-binding protein 1C|nr:MAG: penicillin-binding protein 1C [Spirochaetae bacterium HGW-Spirochaetae-3]
MSASAFAVRFLGAAAAKAVRGAGISAAWARGRDAAPALAGAALFAFALVAFDPSPREAPPYSNAVYAESGELLGAKAASDGQWRLAASSAAPARYTEALVAYEDRRFYGHAGFDPLAIARAALSNVRAGRIVSGGSTITMQAARLSREPGPRDWGSKLAELWAAVRLELRHDKADIVELYARNAPYGGNVVGLQAAGFRWFGRPTVDLTWAEAASLAVLPNSPGLVHPGRSRDELRRKRDALLASLAERGAMSAEDYRSALAEALPESPKPMPALAPHLLAKAGAGRVDTTIDYSLQIRANEAAARHASRYARYGVRNLAAVVLRVDDGSIAAYIGNAPARPGASAAEEGRAAPWVDCAVAPRSSGSILKPFLYAAMLDTGELSPRRLVPDIPTRVGSYSPENNLKTYAGAVRAEEALARSLNVPFVRLLRGYGVERFASLLGRLGFSTLSRAPADYGLTLILGGAEATLVDAAAAYAALARAAKAGSGAGVEPFVGASWRKDSPATARRYDPPFSAGAAWLTLEALVDVGRPGDDASWQEYASSRRVAWKTGTSFGSRDAWAVGATVDYVVGVWVGNADGEGRPELKGTDAAAPLLFDLFQSLPRSRWFDEPARSLRYETVCVASGYVAGPDCAETERVRVPVGSRTDLVCPYCRSVLLSADGRYRVRAENASADSRLERRFSLPPAMEWYYSRSTMGYRPLPPRAPGTEGPEAGAVEFLAPEEGASIFVPIDLDGDPGMAVFRAAHRDPSARLFWHLDGDYLGETVGDHRVQARPAPGPHELVVIDQDGSSASRRFEVYSRN